MIWACEWVAGVLGIGLLGLSGGCDFVSKEKRCIFLSEVEWMGWLCECE